MATLPQGNGAISAGVEYRQLPSLTWSINKETNRIEGNTDRLSAVSQAADIIINTERFEWQIYKAFSGVRLNDLVGLESDFVAAELQRRIREALSMDDRIEGISNYTATVDGDTMTVSFQVLTVYGETDPITFAFQSRREGYHA